MEIQKKIAEGKPGTSSAYMGIGGGISATKDKPKDSSIDDNKYSPSKITKTESEKFG